LAAFERDGLRGFALRAMKFMNPRLVRWARRIDGIWWLLAKFASVFGVEEAQSVGANPRRILVVDLHLIGDMVMLLPFLRALRQRYPMAEIALVAGPWSRSVLDGTAAADQVIEYVAPWVKHQGAMNSARALVHLLKVLRSQRWDIGVEMRGDIRNILLLYMSGCAQRVGFEFTGGSALLTTVVDDDGRLGSILDHHERLAAALGAFDGQPFVPRLALSEEEKRRANEIAEYIGFHFGASSPLRRLPASEATALIEACAQQLEVRLCMFSAPDMEGYVSEVMSGLPPALRTRIDLWKGDLRSFVVAASRARVLYTMDSGPAHLAAATGANTVVMFGPNRAAFTAPRGPNVRCVELENPLPCQPCDQHRCVHPDTPQACLRGLTPAALAAARALGASQPLVKAGSATARA
jgi:ADP-heptose:LPS heptosyltransferase